MIPSRPTNAFTLIETVISLAVMSVLLVGLSGAVMIGTHAIPTATETGLVDQAVIDSLNQFRNDLRQATVIEYTSTGTEKKFKLKIKNSGQAGVPQELHYRYITGSKIFARKVNGRTEQNMFSNVSSFSVQFTQEGTDATSMWIIMVVSDTVQQIFELHIALPDKPKLK